MPEYDKKDGDYPWTRERLYDDDLNHIEDGIENVAENTIQYGAGTPGDDGDNLADADEDNCFYIDTSNNDIYRYDGSSWVQITLSNNSLVDDDITLTGGNAIDNINGSNEPIKLGGSATINVSSDGIGGNELNISDVKGNYLGEDTTNDEIDVNISNGLTGDGANNIIADAYNGITVDSNGISADAYNGITVDSNGISADAYNGITVDSNGISANAYNGITVDSNGISADSDSGISVSSSGIATDGSAIADSDGYTSEGSSSHQVKVNLGGGLEGDTSNNIRVNGGAVAGTLLLQDSNDGSTASNNHYQLNVDESSINHDGIDQTTVSYNDHHGLGNGLDWNGNNDPYVPTDAIGSDELDTTNVTLDEFATPASSISMGGYKLTNVSNPTNAQDATTQNWVYNNTINLTTLDSGTITIDADSDKDVIFKNPNNKPYFVSWRVVNNYRSRIAKMHKKGYTADEEAVVFTNLQEDFSTDVEYKIYTVE